MASSVRRRVGPSNHEYEQVATSPDEDEAGAPLSAQDQAWFFVKDRVYPYLMSCGYVGLAWWVAKQTDIVGCVQRSNQLDRFYFKIGAGLLILNTVIAIGAMAMMHIWPMKEGQKMEEYMPNTIPIASFIGVFCAIL